MVAESSVEEGVRSRTKEEEDWTLKGFNVHDEFPDFEEGTYQGWI